MNKEELTLLIEKLSAEMDGKKRNAIVSELCKEKGIKIGEAWKFLKEAGFNPKAAADIAEGTETNDAPENTGASQADAEAEALKKLEEETAKIKADAAAKNEKVSLTVCHKTEFEKYRCAGLVLTRKPQNYLVTEDQIEKLERDPWVVVSR